MDCDLALERTLGELALWQGAALFAIAIAVGLGAALAHVTVWRR